ncbi:hypothetical protein QJS10_CPA05g01345 [Acorus calamus]|uniref:Uncharacterized protein n=1 Tax=Acorus calamus TaxID=4465 RepID=A0AAV9EPN5_ACOCL|nr:hypothetical protein QJS10_CPA05g01345 [Acorus calamus]
MTMIVLMFKSLVRLGDGPGEAAGGVGVDDTLSQQSLAEGRESAEAGRQEDLLDAENYLFHFIITFMRCI